MRVVFILFSIIFSLSAQAQGDCRQPLAEKRLKSLFEQLAVKQLRLEFQEPVQVSVESMSAVGSDLLLVQAKASYRLPNEKQAEQRPATGWITRCNGTVIFRDNTWLANGYLQVMRYTKDQLPGSGIIIGDANAPIKLIAFVDSRCPHCHRLVDYAGKLAQQGKIVIEIRQVAFFESAVEALADTRLWQTASYAAEPNVQDSEYLQMLGGLSSEAPVEKKNSAYFHALRDIRQNTKTAREILRVARVPALLILDRQFAEQAYRLTGYWEMNRFMQPALFQ